MNYSPIPEHFLSAINNAIKGELLIAISRSGSSKQVLQATELAKAKGLEIIVMTAKQNSPLSRLGTSVIRTMTENGLFEEDHSPASHLYEMAINDLLIYSIENRERLDQRKCAESEDKGIDIVEHILSEYKL